MQSVKIANNDIVSLILDQASPDVQDRVHQAIQTNPEAATDYALWCRVLHATRARAAQEQAMQQRAMDAVMGRIREMPTPATEAPSFWEFRPQILWRMAFAGVAAFGVLVIGYLFLGALSPSPVLERTLPTPVQHAKTTSSDLNTAEYYVAVAPDELEEWTTLRSFSSLYEAVDAVGDKGAIIVREAKLDERIRISKPVRLQAIGDGIRIDPS